MEQLPTQFVEYTSALMGDEKWKRYVASFEEETPTSVRLNPFKPCGYEASRLFDCDVEAIPWCKGGYWLGRRPSFTDDPLFHAGCYYVQEAGSMFLAEVMRQYVGKPVLMLDLCAAPGGKSTLARGVLPEGSLLLTNEPDRRRANILTENIQKQGHPDVIVTQNLHHHYSREALNFDVILTDVPCSGEGLFRRDRSAIGEWNIANVHRCASLQREIVTEIWKRLKPGGLLIYSTCTFNTQENEENVRYVRDELGAELQPVAVSPGWNITGSLLAGFDEPVYRFIPGISKSEGLFMCVLRKNGNECSENRQLPSAMKGTILKKTRLNIIYDGIPRDMQKGRDNIPSHCEALSISRDATRFPTVELPREEALSYLHREAVTLPQATPRGYVVVCYDHHPLGFMKNIGTRANNLYPKEWAIHKSK